MASETLRARLEALVKRSVLIDVGEKQQFDGLLTEMRAAAEAAGSEGLDTFTGLLGPVAEKLGSGNHERAAREKVLAMAMGFVSDAMNSPDTGSVHKESVSKLLAEISALLADIAKTASAAPAPSQSQTPAFACSIPELDLEGMKDLLCEFIAESEDHLSNAENALLALEKSPGNPEEINKIFRAFHTIKGSASFMNLGDIRVLTHETETMMDMVRKGSLGLAPAIVDVILKSIDASRKLISLLREQIENNGALKSPYYDVGPQVILVRETISGQKPAAAAPKLGEMLLKETVLVESELKEALTRQTETGESKKIGEILVEKGFATPAQVERAVQAQQDATQHQPQAVDQAVKIAVHKLDSLIDLVGELVISGTQVMQNRVIRECDDNRLEKDVAQLERIIRDVQDIAMSMRLVPIRPVFQKMLRLIHDVSKKAGKEVDARLTGEETEIDKNIIDLISDPLMHMVRNSVDHGIEKAQDRKAAGKPAAGTVHLNACHRGGNIAIEIRDDGAGLNREKILAKARSRGMVRENEVPPDAKLYSFIFDPGFSTADAITDISGRGVGMDVVKRNIDQLRGKVEIQTEPGKGTLFTIKLPLTLAIIDGIVLSVGTERYIVPVTSIVEFFSPDSKDVTDMPGKGRMLKFQGNLYQLIALDELFGVASEFKSLEQRTVCLVETDAGRVCVAVDRVLGQQQVVIKNLGDSLKQVKGVAGGTILGDGKVGLILDMNGVVEKFRE